MLSRCLRTPVWPTTATNGSYFLLRAMLQMLVSVVKLWSMSGALTGSGESPPLALSLSQFSLFGVILVLDTPPASRSDVDSWHPLRMAGEIGVPDHHYQTNVASAQSCAARF